MDKKRKFTLLCITAVMLISLGAVGIYYWYANTYFVTTEDAKIAGDFVKIAPQVSGKLVELNIQEGDRVAKDQIIGRIEALGLDTAGIDTSLLRAPLAGLIVKKQANVGEYVASNSAPTLALMVDPDKLYVNANIEETKIEQVKPGQAVDISVDQLKNTTLKGRVESIGAASNSAFSLLPASSSGTFTKVVQTVPVKIVLENAGVTLTPGTNAVVKIHIK